MTSVLLAIVAAPFLALTGLAVWLIGRCAGGLALLVTRRSPNSVRTAAWVRKWTYAAGSIVLVYSVYDAVYLSDDFFLGEYAEVTLRPAPTSARVVAKSASFPDLHGDYCSFSRIELGAMTYEQVLRELSADTRLSPGDGVGSDEEDKVQRQLPRLGVRRSFTRSVPGEEDRFLAIRFLDDGTHIEVSVCIT